MKRLTRALFLSHVVLAVLCAVLLLDITAPNPTGRRSSSEVVVTRGDSNVIGDSGESALATDLNLPNNNAREQRQCICSRSYRRSGCNSCLVTIPTASQFRLPDFVGKDFLAESKNSLVVPDNYEQLHQLQDYVYGALALKRPLWVYVRIDTQVTQELTLLVEATGGGIVHYFRTPGYVDPVETAALVGLVSSGFASMTCLVLVMPHRSPRRPKTPTTKWQANNIPDVLERAKQKAQATIDKEDSRHKL